MSHLIKSKTKLGKELLGSVEKGELVELDMSKSVYVGIDIEKTANNYPHGNFIHIVKLL
ncbi:MAG: hypothetical protein ACKVTZ_01415 [Bacteroidia bacterium]